MCRPHTQSPFCVGQLLLGFGPDLECVDVPSDTALKKTDFSFFQQVSIANSFLARVGALWIFLLFRAEVLFDLNLGGLLRAVTDSEFTCVSGLFCLEDSVSLESPTITSSFCLFFLTDPWALTGRNAIKTSQLALSTPKSLTLSTLLGISLLLITYYKRKLQIRVKQYSAEPKPRVAALDPW